MLSCIIPDSLAKVWQVCGGLTGRGPLIKITVIDLSVGRSGMRDEN